MLLSLLPAASRTQSIWALRSRLLPNQDSDASPHNGAYLASQRTTLGQKTSSPKLASYSEFFIVPTMTMFLFRYKMHLQPPQFSPSSRLLPVNW
ncbi:hypothetical protein BpHYR1_009501 [Brachionus plicatilis]|uniref:Uncharacterized protein n=1 Tax=Brachionus plicatilis TaxID=10195 RepID=A0A3M7QIF4_BRAPC|nr:hypothetical protein BpHYR1_009501 [Brachionus plicatilis]